MTMPRPLGLAALLVLAVAAPAVAADKPPANTPPKPATSGRASFRFGEQAITYDKVRGTFKQSYGLTVVSLVFGDEGADADHLNLNLFLKRKGRVDLEGSYENGVGYWTSGKVYAFTKGKSRCKMQIVKLTTSSLEGKADCPVLNEVNGSGKQALSGLTFSAAAE